MIKRTLLFSFLFTLLMAGLHSKSAPNPALMTEYERLVTEAHGYDCAFVPGAKVNRNLAVNLYYQAVKAEPNNPKNVDLLLRIGQLLICNFNTDRGETCEPEQALAAFKQIFELHEKRKSDKYWPKELSGMIFLGEAYMSTRQSELGLATFLRFFSIKPEQLEFSPHEWAEIPEKDRVKAVESLRTKTYQQIKEIMEDHVRMVVGPLNHPANYERLKMLQQRFPNARLLPPAPHSPNTALVRDSSSKGQPQR